MYLTARALTVRPPKGVGGGSRSALPFAMLPDLPMPLDVFRKSRMSACKIEAK